MESETFPTRSEAIDFGKDYEFLMAAYYGFSFAFNDKIADFKISSNNKEMGDFDDVVIEIELRDSQRHLFALQLKHVKRQIALITLTNTKSKNKNFSLDKYTKEFASVKKHCQNDVDFKNFHFILYTNSNLENSDAIDELGTRLEILDNNNQITDSEFTIFKSKDNFCEDFFDLSETRDCIYKFKTDKDSSIEEEFFKQFSLYTNQKSAPEMESFISRQLFERLKICDPDVVVNYLNYFKHWCRRDFGAFKITKDDLLIKFADYLLTPLIPDVELKEIEYFPNTSNTLTHVLYNESNTLTLVETGCQEKIINKVWGLLLNHFCDNLSIDTNNIVNKIWDVVLSDFADNEFEWTTPIPGLQINAVYKFHDVPMSALAENFKTLSLLALYKIFWHSNFFPLVIKIDQSSTDHVMSAFKLCSQTRNCQKKKFIVIGEQISKEILTVMEDWKILQNLADLSLLSNEFDSFVSELVVSIQGRPRVPLKIILKDDHLSTLFSLNEILQMLEGSFVIGKSSEEDISDNYITRHVSRIYLDIKAIDSTENDVFIMSSSIDPEEAAKYLKPQICQLETYLLLQGQENYTPKQISLQQFLKTKSTNFDFKDNFVIFTETLCSKDNFDKISAMNPAKNCHHVRLIDENRIEWLQTRGSISNLAKHRLPDEDFIRDDEIFQEIPNKVNVLIADPGMGKSFLFRFLKKTCPASYLAFKINLNRHVNYFKDTHEFGDLIEYFINLEFGTAFEVNFAHYLASQKKILFLWDGFDELPKDCVEAVIFAIESIASRDLFQFISARSVSRAFLESKLNTFSFNMRLLAMEEQTQFVAYYLLDADDKTIAAVVKKINDNIKYAHIGNPLHIYMLLEIFKSDPTKFIENTKIITLTDMYEEFTHGKFKSVFFKADADIENPFVEEMFEKYKDELVDRYKILAIKSIFSEETRHLPNCEFDDDNGIVSGLGDDNRAIFTHETYREFFAASWFVDNYHTERELFKRLFDKEYQNVRKMFDMIVARNSSPHIAVLYRQPDLMESVLDQVPSTRDSVGRNVLQLACSWGTSHSLIKTVTSDEDKISIELDSTSAIEAEDSRYLQVLNLLLKNNLCDPREKDDFLNWSSIDYADKTLSLATLDVISKYHALNSEDLNISNDKPTVLHYCAALNYINLSKIFEKIPFIQYDDHKTLLQVAVEADNFEFVSRLVNFDCYLNKDDNLISLAINNSNYEMFELFLNKRIDVNSCKIPPLTTAARKGLLKFCERLIKVGAEVNCCNSDDYSPLFLAAQFEHKEIVELLLKNGADVNYINNKELSALTFPVFKNSPEIANIILKYNPDVNLCPELLHGACQLADVTIVKELLASGADTTATTSASHATPLIIAIICSRPEIARELILKDKSVVNVPDKHQLTPVIYATIRNLPETIKILAESGADLNFGLGALHIAADNNFAECVRVLLESGADVNKVNPDDNTALFYANTALIAGMLIESGAEINYTNSQGVVPLHGAIFNDRFEVVEELIKRGADVNVRDNNNNSVLFWCFKNKCAKICEFLLKNCNVQLDNRLVMDAIGFGSVECLQVLLQYGADVNFGGDRTPLCKAAYVSEDCIDILLNNGADINLEDDSGNTPLIYALSFGNTKTAKKLIDCGADLEKYCVLHVSAETGNIIATVFLINAGCDVNNRDKYGKTALHYAAFGSSQMLPESLVKHYNSNVDSTYLDVYFSNNHFDCAKELISKGADLNMKDNNLDTPLHVACQRGLEKFVDLFVTAGADVNSLNKSKQSPLDLAFITRNNDCIEILMKNGAHFNISNARDVIDFLQDTFDFKIGHLNKLALEHAVSENLLQDLEVYCESGADINIVDDEGLTLLHRACYEGHLEIVEYLLDKGVDIESKNFGGATPLFCACSRNHLNLVLNLLQKSARVNAQDNKGNTPLHLASDERIIKTLRSFGADFSIKNHAGNNALHVACLRGSYETAKCLLELNANFQETDADGNLPLHLAICNGPPELIELLICDNKEYLNHQNHDGMSAIFAAVLMKKWKIVKLLIDKGADLSLTDCGGFKPCFFGATANREMFELLCENCLHINSRAKNGLTLLQVTCNARKPENVMFLLENGAEINATTDDNSTALHFATQNKNLEMIQILLENGADMTVIRTLNNCSPIGLAALNEDTDILEIFLEKSQSIVEKEMKEKIREQWRSCFMAASSRSLKVLQFLLNNNIVEVNYQNTKQETALHHACYFRKTEIVAYLFQKGANVNALDNKKETPLMFFSNRREALDLEIFRLLVENGADVNARSDFGHSALFGAAANGHLDLVKMLREKGAEINVVDFEGDTPLHDASANGHLDVVEYLIENGADVNCRNHKGKTPQELQEKLH